VSDTDKAKNKIQDLGGQAKEALGKVTGDKSTEHEGCCASPSMTMLASSGLTTIRM